MSPEYNKSLRRVTKPQLEALGYEFDGKSRFTKIGSKGNAYVIEYQLGTRSMQGQFTVNLISGERLERLAMISPTLMSKLVDKIFGGFDPWWKGIFLPKDYWWEISPFQKEMDSIIQKTVTDLKTYGISWFDDKA
ncbi:MAG: hypothetical protein L3J22_10500 [Xanthomonadales bacterium]|nr:hypothetical protein [Xanthomonadales bacterium]